MTEQTILSSHREMKGYNPVAKSRKMTIYNANIDLVKDNVLKNLVSVSLFVLKVLNKKLNSGVNQGPNLCCKFAKMTFYNPM